MSTGFVAEEEKNRAARDSDDPTFAGGAVSNGLQGDLIQPLVIRANQGDCLRITLRNQIADEPTNMIVNGSQMLVASTGKPATANNPDALVPAGKSGEFEWYIPIDTTGRRTGVSQPCEQGSVFLGPAGVSRR